MEKLHQWIEWAEAHPKVWLDCVRIYLGLGLFIRGLFIINPEGVLQYSVVHDLNIGRSVDETLRVLQGLQTGGLCSADWKPGQANLTV